MGLIRARIRPSLRKFDPRDSTNKYRAKGRVWYVRTLGIPILIFYHLDLIGSRINLDKEFKPGKENIHAGKAEVYGMTYGPFYIVMNCGKRTQTVPVPKIYRGSKDVQTGKKFSKSKMKVKRGETIVLYNEKG